MIKTRTELIYNFTTQNYAALWIGSRFYIHLPRNWVGNKLSPPPERGQLVFKFNMGPIKCQTCRHCDTFGHSGDEFTCALGVQFSDKMKHNRQAMWGGNFHCNYWRKA